MRTVLLFLQSEEFRYAMHEALREHYHVLSAQDTTSGADLLKEQPDILLLDLFLSGTNGFLFLEQNCSLLPPTVVLFTTLINLQILQTASDLGVDEIFLIPCSIRAVLKRLEQI